MRMELDHVGVTPHVVPARRALDGGHSPRSAQPGSLGLLLLTPPGGRGLSQLDSVSL